jgi:RNA methyltransferase, TrmH family
MTRTISSLQNTLVKHLVKIRQNSDYRFDHKTVIIEGYKILDELLGNIRIKTLLAYDQSFIPPHIKAEEILWVSEEVMKKVSGLKTPDGIIAEVEMPKPAALKEMQYIVALDGVSDPGNLGTILRTALALGWDGIFILGESCDPYNEKALRAARGATFRLPIAWGTWQDLKDLVEANKLHAIIADLKGKKLQEVHPKEGILLVLSNEAHGISAEAEKICEKVTILMPGPMESLNVSIAGGIMMHSLMSKSVNL